jgi:hypothetical protein
MAGEDETVSKVRLEADPGNTAQVMSDFADRFYKADEAVRGMNAQNFGALGKAAAYLGPTA